MQTMLRSSAVFLKFGLWVVLASTILYQNRAEASACDPNTHYQCGTGDTCCEFDQDCDLSGNGSGQGACKNGPGKCEETAHFFCYNKTSKVGACCPYIPGYTYFCTDNGCAAAPVGGSSPTGQDSQGGQGSASQPLDSGGSEPTQDLGGQSSGNRLKFSPKTILQIRNCGTWFNPCP